MKKSICIIHELQYLISIFGLETVKDALVRIEEQQMEKKDDGAVSKNDNN